MEKCFVSVHSSVTDPDLRFVAPLRARTRRPSTSRWSRAGRPVVVRVNTAKLTYPVLSAFFDEVRAIVEERRPQAGPRPGGGQLHRQRDDRLPGGDPPPRRRPRRHAEAVLRLQRRVRGMLSMTGVDRFLEIYDDAAEALASFGRREEGAHRA